MRSTPGVDRTAAAVADPASYTQRINRAREASQPQDAESKFGSYVGRLRRARESNDAKDPNSASSRRILAAAAAAQTGAPAAEPGAAVPRAAAPSTAAPSTAIDRARRASADSQAVESTDDT